MEVETEAPEGGNASDGNRYIYPLYLYRFPLPVTPILLTMYFT